MTGHQIGILLSAISFAIGAGWPVFTSDEFNWRKINWISLGLAWWAFAAYIGAPH